MSHRFVFRQGPRRARGKSVQVISHAIEAMESRRLLAAVAWDGLGDGVNWTDGANWSNDVVPTSADDVTIDVAGSPVITLRGSRSVRTLVNAETVRVLSDNSVGPSVLSIGVSASNTGTLAMESADSTWQVFVQVNDGATLTNSGTIEARAGAGGVRAISLGIGGASAATFVNNGTITVQSGTAMEFNGTGGSLDEVRQNGTINIASGSSATTSLVRLNYIGGFNQPGLFMRNGTQIDLDAASAPSVITSVGGSNLLLGHDAANLTLLVRGDNTYGTAVLNIPASMTNAGTIELSSVDSTWTSSLSIADGAMLTNTGTIRTSTGAGGPRSINLGTGGASAAGLINNGTIDATGTTRMAINGTGGSLDLLRQNGLITIAPTAQVVASLVLLHYTGGSNQAGFLVHGGTQIDLDAASAASTVTAVSGSDILLGHDAPNLTLRVQGDNVFGTASLAVSSPVVSLGIIEIESIDSNWTAQINVADGATLTNNGTLRIRQGTGGPRAVNLGVGGALAAGLVNNGTIDVGTGTVLSVNGSSGSLDLFRQNGVISITAGSYLNGGNVLFNYQGGSNQPGLRVFASQIDIDAASTPSTVVAAGGNTFLDHASPLVTLLVQGNNAFGTANLAVPAPATNAGVITFESIDSTWGCNMQVADGVTFTNNGTLRSNLGAGGPRNLNLGTGAATPATFITNGTIGIGPGAILNITGSGGSLDQVTQNGIITVAAAGGIHVGTVRFSYVGGTNQSGLAIYNSQLDLVNAASPSTVIAGGANTLLGLADSDITLLVQGNNTFGTGNLIASAGSFNSGKIIFDSIESSWGARLQVGDGITFTNNPTGELRLLKGPLGGPRAFDISTSTLNPGLLINAGTIRIDQDQTVDGSGRLQNTGLISKPDAGESVFNPFLANGASGIVDVLAGTLRFVATNIDDPSAGFLAGGHYRVANGATLAFGFSPSQRPHVNTADVEVTGTGFAELDYLQVNRGRIALLSGADLTISPIQPFTLEGIIELSATSLLTINANVTLAGTSQPVVLSELASATDFGKLRINGMLNLDSPSSTSRFDPDLVGIYDPPIGARHDVVVATGGITNAFDSFQGGLTPSNNVLLATRPDAQTLAVEVGPGPLPPPPQILSQAFEYQTRQAVVFQFDQNVSAFLSRKDYQLQNLTLSLTIPNSVGTLTYNQLSNQATLTFTNQVPDGNYRLTINASDIANSAGVPSSGSPITLDFFILGADANRDRAVNLDDFTALAANFGLTDRTFGDGDFNYDTTVNLDDFTILASQFGKSLPALSGLSRLASVTGGVSSTRSPFGTSRIVDDVLTA